MILFMMLAFHLGWAEPVAEVVKVRGSVFSSAEKIFDGASINMGAVIEIKDESVVVLKLKHSGMMLRYSGPGSVQINNSVLNQKKQDVVDLVKGTLRIRSGDKKDTNTFIIKSPAAVAGVRGTDFFLKYDPFLSEAEVVVFDGTIDFQNAKLTRDKKTVPKGHWGGVGGRYGSKIGALIKLPNEILNTFDESLTWF